MVRFPRLRLMILIVATALGATAVGFWFLWWVTKTAYSCDGLPRGGATPASAAHDFVTSLASSDTAAMCRILSNKLNDDQLVSVMTNLRERLGNPEQADQIVAVIGEQGGIQFSLELTGPDGGVELHLLSFQGWYRVSV